MFQVIATWQVVLHDGTQFRVPESNLDAFLRVLTFNRDGVRRAPRATGADASGAQVTR